MEFAENGFILSDKTGWVEVYETRDNDEERNKTIHALGKLLLGEIDCMAGAYTDCEINIDVKPLNES